MQPCNTRVHNMSQWIRFLICKLYQGAHLFWVNLNRSNIMMTPFWTKTKIRLCPLCERTLTKFKSYQRIISRDQFWDNMDTWHIPQQSDQKFEQNSELVDPSVGRDRPTQEVNFWRKGEEQLRRKQMVFSLGQETCCINHWFNVLRHHWVEERSGFKILTIVEQKVSMLMSLIFRNEITH